MFRSNGFNFDHYSNALFRYYKKELLKALQEEKQPSYRDLEYEGVTTTITDKDMLKIQIDGALDSGNKELFMQLTSQLEELECTT